MRSAAILAAAGGFAMAPWTEDGKPVDGAKVRIPIRYVDGAAEEAGAEGARP